MKNLQFLGFPRNKTRNEKHENICLACIHVQSLGDAAVVRFFKRHDVKAKLFSKRSSFTQIFTNESKINF